MARRNRQQLESDPSTPEEAAPGPAEEPVTAPPPENPSPEAAPVVEPPPAPPPAVSREPTVSDLRADYDRLAKLVPTLKAGSPEFRQAMDEKRRAFIAWHKVANA